MSRTNASNKMKRLQENKNACTAESYCSYRKTKFLFNYMEAVLDIEFAAEPYYEKLRFILISELLKGDVIPTKDVLLPKGDDRYSLYKNCMIAIDEMKEKLPDDPSASKVPIFLKY